MVIMVVITIGTIGTAAILGTQVTGIVEVITLGTVAMAILCTVALIVELTDSENTGIDDSQHSGTGDYLYNETDDSYYSPHHPTTTLMAAPRILPFTVHGTAVTMTILLGGAMSIHIGTIPTTLPAVTSHQCLQETTIIISKAGMISMTPHWWIQRGAAGACPPTGSISFVFAYVFAKKCTRRRLAPPLMGRRPPQWKILDPPLHHT